MIVIVFVVIATTATLTNGACTVRNDYVVCLYQGFTEFPPLPENAIGVFIEFNDIRVVPHGIFRNLTKLETLWLVKNDHEIIEDGAFIGLSSLTELDLYSNRIRSISRRTFTGLTALKRLELGDNLIKGIPKDTFRDLTLLRILFVDKNIIKIIPDGIFAGLTLLGELYLNENLISAIPNGTFKGLTRLRILWLRENLISALPSDLFKELTSLTQLYLDDNEISALPSGLFKGLTSLQELDLEYNLDLVCGCELIAVLSDLNKTAVEISGTCQNNKKKKSEQLSSLLNLPLCGTSHYTFYDTDGTWNQARAACRNKNAHLVTMETTAEWNTVKNLLAKRVKGKTGNYHYCIGLRRQNGAWRWSEERQGVTPGVVAVNDHRWQPYEPSKNFDEPCGEIQSNYLNRQGYFNNIVCNYKPSSYYPRGYICEEEYYY